MALMYREEESECCYVDHVFVTECPHPGLGAPSCKNCYLSSD